MAITLRRQLSDAEKQIILQRHGRRCFATNHDIPESESVHFDHIRAYALAGATELDNIAPMCGDHNRAKGTLPLEDFRIKLKIQGFFETGDRLTLRDLLEYLKQRGEIQEFGRSVAISPGEDCISLSTSILEASYPLHICPRTGWKYFFARLPIEVVNSDDDTDGHLGLQPRYLIMDKVFEMYRHFQNYPVLQPSIGRIDGEKILLFDGQHKAAALLFGQQSDIECKVYVAPDIRVLNQANISAHDKFAQTRFYSSIMVLKLGTQFGRDFDEFKNIEDGSTKSEAAFLDFLARKDSSLTTGELRKRFRSYLMNAVLESEDNRLSRLVSPSNRRTGEHPLTVDMLSKSLFSAFFYMDPLPHDLLTEQYRRDAESQNLIRLMNLIYEDSLSTWQSADQQPDDNQLALRRIYSSKSMMAWAELFRDAVCAKLDIHDADEKTRPFYRDLGDHEFETIRTIFGRLAGWQMWRAPRNSEIDTAIAGNKSAIKDWFRNKGLTTGFLMGADL